MITDYEDVSPLVPDVLHAASIKTGVDQHFGESVDAVSRDAQETLVTPLATAIGASGYFQCSQERR